MNSVCPEGTWEGNYSFGFEKNLEIPFPIVKITHREASGVNGQFAILDEVVVFLVSSYVLFIFSVLF